MITSHLQTEGKCLLFPEQVPDNKRFRILFQLDDGSMLAYQDVRKFGTMELLYPSQIEAYLQRKESDPESAEEASNLSESTRKLKASRKVTKPHLSDQALIIGLGDIYIGEALWTVRIHPKRIGSSSTDSEIALLHDEIIRILQLGISKGGATVRTYHNTFGGDGDTQQFLRVYGKADEPYPCYAAPIEEIKVKGRGAHLCPTCQKR